MDIVKSLFTALGTPGTSYSTASGAITILLSYDALVARVERAVMMLRRTSVVTPCEWEEPPIFISYYVIKKMGR